MDLNLADCHPIFSLSQPLLKYSEGFLKKHELNYFQVIRVNNNGETTVLTNHLNFTSFCLSWAIKHKLPLVYSHVNNKTVNPASYTFLWEPNLPIDPVKLIRNEFNISNGLTFVERYPTHYYMFAFAAPTTNQNVLDFYLNNLDLLQNFINRFKEERKDLLIALEKQPLILPPELQDRNLKDMLLNTPFRSHQRISICYKGNESYITPKEYDCIQQLRSGLSAKQIGQVLNISHRTIEKYFERIKERTGCRYKKDLIQLQPLPGTKHRHDNPRRNEN